MEKKRKKNKGEGKNVGPNDKFLNKFILFYFLSYYPNNGKEARLVGYFKHQFSIFKQHFTYFYTLFHPHVFQKTINNTTQTPLPNGP